MKMAASMIHSDIKQLIHITIKDNIVKIMQIYS